ncbi:5-oxoprolinase subunit PxpA [Echinicola jeungdonensis]|uniref:5-oxoprolinase subunit PxpA n=1 Tax=Echinicola jeungdonensis TaxID=709343 RepID=A0ABV5J315_9BACT|nr:5-oxoprolinase subunit PxpA [Echinicola jeungdonensis]MDN3670565.1 5-oxoprolinase subunit PxpA [Echinicola jeungdonensis]
MMKIDINSDLGEGMPYEEELMPYITSCNIACGGHTGNELTMTATLERAKKFQLNIGAHPSYPDKEHFGRKSMKMEKEEMAMSLLNQIKSLEKLANKTGQKIHHIKPHGALYNDAAINYDIAQVIIGLMVENFPETFLFAPNSSIIEKMAKEHGVKTKSEIFADRKYLDNLSLVPRTEKNAVLIESKEVIDHLYRMVFEGYVKTVTGKIKPIKADTVCVHGDNPSALALVKEIYEVVNIPMEE